MRFNKALDNESNIAWCVVEQRLLHIIIEWKFIHYFRSGSEIQVSTTEQNPAHTRIMVMMRLELRSLRFQVGTLRKIPQLHLISWCGNFVERQFVSACGNCTFLQNFYTRKLGEITAFYAVET